MIKDFWQGPTNRMPKHAVAASGVAHRRWAIDVAGTGGVASMGRLHGRVLAFVWSLVLALSYASVQGQSEKFELRHRLARGETLTYGYTLNVSNWFRVMSIYRSDSRQTAGQQIVNVKGVGEDGTFTLEIVRYLRMTTQGRTEDTSPPPAEVRMHPTGQILKSAASGVGDLLLRLPEYSVGVDDSWTVGEYLGNAGLAGRIIVGKSLSLAGVEQIGEQRVARIRVRGESPFSIDTPLATGAAVARLRMRGTIQLTGEVLWLLDQGRMLRFSEEVGVDTPIQVEFEGQTVPGRFVFKSVEQLESTAGKN